MRSSWSWRCRWSSTTRFFEISLRSNIIQLGWHFVLAKINGVYLVENEQNYCKETPQSVKTQPNHLIHSWWNNKYIAPIFGWYVQFDHLSLDIAWIDFSITLEETKQVFLNLQMNYEPLSLMMSWGRPWSTRCHIGHRKPPTCPCNSVPHDHVYR